MCVLRHGSHVPLFLEEEVSCGSLPVRRSARARRPRKIFKLTALCFSPARPRAVHCCSRACACERLWLIFPSQPRLRSITCKHVFITRLGVVSITLVSGVYAVTKVSEHVVASVARNAR